MWTNKDVAALLAGSGARVHVIGPGDAFSVGGIPMHAHGEWHAEIHPDVPRVRNTGFLFDGRVFHPGDAYTNPHTAVDLLFVPEFGLYTKFGYAIDFIRQVKPKQASPIHDTGLDAQGIAGADGFLVQHPTPPFAPGTGSPFAARLPKRDADHRRSQNLRPIEIHTAADMRDRINANASLMFIACGGPGRQGRISHCDPRWPRLVSHRFTEDTTAEQCI